MIDPQDTIAAVASPAGTEHRRSRSLANQRFVAPGKIAWLWHRPKALFDSLTLSAAKRRHSGAPTLEKVGQSRSQRLQRVTSPRLPFGGIGAHCMPLFFPFFFVTWPSVCGQTTKCPSFDKMQ